MNQFITRITSQYHLLNLAKYGIKNEILDTVLLERLQLRYRFNSTFYKDYDAFINAFYSNYIEERDNLLKKINVYPNFEENLKEFDAVNNTLISSQKETKHDDIVDNFDSQVYRHNNINLFDKTLKFIKELPQAPILQFLNSFSNIFSGILNETENDFLEEEEKELLFNTENILLTFEEEVFNGDEETQAELNDSIVKVVKDNKNKINENYNSTELGSNSNYNLNIKILNNTESIAELEKRIQILELSQESQVGESGNWEVIKSFGERELANNVILENFDNYKMFKFFFFYNDALTSFQTHSNEVIFNDTDFRYMPFRYIYSKFELLLTPSTTSYSSAVYSLRFERDNENLIVTTYHYGLQTKLSGETTAGSVTSLQVPANIRDAIRVTFLGIKK